MSSCAVRFTRALIPLTVIALVATACGGEPSPGEDGDLQGATVNVIGTWGGDEQTAFLEMVKPWEEQTGATVKYTGTRDINAVLTTGVASGVLPDLAGLPGPGQMAEYAAAGALQPLDDVLDIATYEQDTAPVLVDLGKTQGQVYGVFIKAAVKGLIWYNVADHDYGASPPTTWTDLLSQARADKSGEQAIWCMGLESGAASGWPGTDWIEDLVLRTAGPDVYTQWYQGQVKWTDPAIRSAFQMFADDVVANTFGGRTTAVATNFGEGGDGLFTDPPKCVFHHQASFITTFSQFDAHAAGTDYNFFPFPDIDPQYAGAVEGAGDLFGMFNDTPAAKSLMAYLVTPEAQNIWVEIGGALSANKNATNYPDDISKRSAELLAGAQIFVFDASDNMPRAMVDAFNTAMVDFTNGTKTIDQVLSDLDTVQADSYATS